MIKQIYLIAIFLLICEIRLCSTVKRFLIDRKILMYSDSGIEQSIIDKGNQISFVDFKSDIVKSVRTEKIINKETEQLPNLFNLLYSMNNYVLIGTLNRVLNISLENLSYKEINWVSETNLDKIRQRSKQCNFINNKEAFPVFDDFFLICGTTQGSSTCQLFKQDQITQPYEDSIFNSQLHSISPIDAKTIDPQKSFAFKHKNSIYSFVSGKFNRNGFIKKFLLTEPDKNDYYYFDYTLAQTYHGAILRNSYFRSWLTHKDKVYFLFQETDELYLNDVQFKSHYSMIGEICDNDFKFSYHQVNLASFKKTQIFCYLPDSVENQHLKYPEIGVSEILRNSSVANESFFFGIFTLRRLNSVDSALCMFGMSDVEKAMRSEFKHFPHVNNYKYKKPVEFCDEKVNDDYYEEVKKYHKFELSDSVIKPALFALSDVKFTSIVVDTANANNNYIDVIYIGTDKGKVLKLILRPENGNLQPVLVQELELFNAQINNLVIHHSSQGTTLMAVSNQEIKSVNFESLCLEYHSCLNCVNSQDPYCTWSSAKSKCMPVRKERLNSQVKRNMPEQCRRVKPLKINNLNDKNKRKN